MKESFSLDKKIEELEAIETYFQSPDIDLEAAITKHKQAVEISKEILDYLDKAESTIEQLGLSDLNTENV